MDQTSVLYRGLDEDKDIYAVVDYAKVFLAEFIMDTIPPNVAVPSGQSAAVCGVLLQPSGAGTVGSMSKLRLKDRRVVEEHISTMATADNSTSTLFFSEWHVLAYPEVLRRPSEGAWTMNISMENGTSRVVNCSTIQDNDAINNNNHK